MKLSEEMKTDLRELDFEYGGGITTISTKTEIIDKPILILGLGGTGVESLIRVKKAIHRQFRLGPRARKADKPAQVEYLALDSDDNMAGIKFMDMSFGEDEFVLLDSSNLTSIYKNRDTVFKYSTHDWIADNLRLQQVKHGAGGIRQAGRFLLTINTNRILSVLTEKINRLTANRNANDLLYVFVLVGCAGGTGSGIFIDIPYIVRRLAEQKGFETENIGMVFLPDVTLSDSMIDGSAALNIKANGFAALKELDYLMNLEQSGEFFEQSYADLEVKTNRPPYDLCHLVSAKDEAGKLQPSAKSYCMNVAAETIINFIASEEVSDGQSYTINSYLSNIENNKAAFLMTHQQKQPVNYIYNTVGAASSALPVDFLVNFLTYKMFDELTPLMDKKPAQEAVQLTLEAMKLDLPALERALLEERPKMRDFGQYDYTVMKERPDIVTDAVKKELARTKEHYEEKAAEIAASFKEMLADKDNVITRQFCDLDTGPYYTLKELSELHSPSLPALIAELREKEIAKRRHHRDTISALELKRQQALEKLRQGAVFGKKAKAAAVLKANDEYLRAMDKNSMYDALDSVYGEVLKGLADYHDNFVDSYCELLTALKELFDKFRDPKGSKRGGTADVFASDIADAAEVCECFEKSPDFSMTVDYKASLKRLLKDMLTGAGWMPDLDNTVVENLNKFITGQFQAVMHKSLDYYCAVLAQNRSQQPDSFIQEKISALYDSAKVMFPMNHIPSGLHITFPPYAYLSVPTNAPQIRGVAKNIAGKMFNIKHSRMVNRLYLINLKIAVALYCYKELNEYEAVYEASANKIVGLHLYESADKNWRNLPSPNYDRLWTAEYENNRERLKNERTREVFGKALKYGLIRLDEKSRKYICYYGEPLDVREKFKAIRRGIKEKNLSPTQARAHIQELDNFLADAQRKIFSTALYDTEFLPEENRPDDEYAKGVFIYMPALNERMAAEVAVREYIEELRGSLEKIDQSEVIYSHFAQALYMGAVFKRRKLYKYIADDTEEILYTMKNINEQYVEYDVFKAYLELPEETAQYLQTKAQTEENQYTDAQFKKLLKVIDELIKTFAEKAETLEQSYQSEREGALKRMFYREMLEVFNKEKAVLS